MSSWINYNSILIHKRKLLEKQIQQNTYINNIVKKEIPEIKQKLNKDNITIILQGIICDNINILDTIAEYINYGKIILSIYKNKTDPNILNAINNNYPSVLIIDNNIGEYDLEYYNLLYNTDIYDKYINNIPIKHIFYQIKSMINVFKYVNTEYIIKFRIDHYISNLSNFIECCINTNKIVSSSYFIRGFSQYKYHISDCLFGCKSVVIEQIYNLAYNNFINNINLVIPEVILWYSYIYNIYNNIDSINDVNKYAELLSNIFYIYPINFHNNYNIKLSKTVRNEIVDYTEYSNYNIITKFIDVPKTTKDYFIKGIDIK